jgi:hypothetical protein
MTRAELDTLIEEATVDCYNDEEQITGLFTKIDEHLAVPFDTEIPRRDRHGQEDRPNHRS